jgi:hypothetical protein
MVALHAAGLPPDEARYTTRRFSRCAPKLAQTVADILKQHLERDKSPHTWHILLDQAVVAGNQRKYCWSRIPQQVRPDLLPWGSSPEPGVALRYE